MKWDCFYIPKSPSINTSGERKDFGMIFAHIVLVCVVDAR